MRVRDDGRGGAHFGHGFGLAGFRDRAEALSCHLRLHSPPGAGTTLETKLPVRDPAKPGPQPEVVDPTEDADRRLAADTGQRIDQP